MGERAVVVFSGGGPPRPDVASLLPAGALVIAADSGVDHALALGVVPAVAVGDFDSVTAAGLEQVVASGGEVRRHPVDKDATDLELALDAAIGLGASRVVVVGSAGGRLDHLLAGVAVLARPSLSTMTIEAHVGGHRLDVVHPGAPRTLEGEVGGTVTLLAWGGPATGVTTTGLRFALRDGVLDPWSSLGVSNEFTGAAASVQVGSGVVLAIAPGDDVQPHEGDDT